MAKKKDTIQETDIFRAAEIAPILVDDAISVEKQCPVHLSPQKCSSSMMHNV